MDINRLLGDGNRMISSIREQRLGNIDPFSSLIFNTSEINSSYITTIGVSSVCLFRLFLLLSSIFHSTASIPSIHHILTFAEAIFGGIKVDNSLLIINDMVGDSQ